MNVVSLSSAGPPIVHFTKNILSSGDCREIARVEEAAGLHQAITCVLFRSNYDMDDGNPEKRVYLTQTNRKERCL
jgi:hypothetical protein